MKTLWLVVEGLEGKKALWLVAFDLEGSANRALMRQGGWQRIWWERLRAKVSRACEFGPRRECDDDDVYDAAGVYAMRWLRVDVAGGT